MEKNRYIEELCTEEPIIRYGSTSKKDVRKIQEWIKLWNKKDPSWLEDTAVDGDFGPHTLDVVKAFQEHFQLTVDGIVGNKTWRKLTEPMRLAFTRINDKKPLREMIVAYAEQQLASTPMELHNNGGPWVRAYMNGNEGEDQPWCMGFVRTVVDQATFTNEIPLKSIIPDTVSCDELAEFGLKYGKLIRKETVRQDYSQVKPGDLFIIYKNDDVKWVHTGIIVKVDKSKITTIEGNTNEGGSREGVEARKRIRDLAIHNIDVYKVTND